MPRCDEKRLEQIGERAAAAQPGPPWGLLRVEDQWGVFANHEDEARRELVFFVPASRLGYASPGDRNVALFCAGARQDVPDLLADLREAREAARILQADLNAEIRIRQGLEDRLKETERARLEVVEQVQRLHALLALESRT